MSGARRQQKGLLARKVGMTQVFNTDGTVSAVTVLEAGPCRVLGLRTEDRHGYEGARLAFEEVGRRKVTKPVGGEFRAAGLEPHRHVAEFRGLQDVTVGQELKADVFAEGELVDVKGTSKGKGFQGMVRRHNFGRGPETHGSMNVRKPGSIGATNAARVFKGTRMAGHMGAGPRTVQALRVVRVDADRNLLLVRGTVPGANGSVVVVRDSTKQKAQRS
ncbi:MAG: 50S ribosomal protein L3 [Candidatus Dormibacteraeota bacterium]|nr:50S ribosomal protein L3 [Candidatus Dormibacteraeota bacterium]